MDWLRYSKTTENELPTELNACQMNDTDTHPPPPIEM